MPLNYTSAINYIVSQFTDGQILHEDFIFKDLTCKYLKGIWYLKYKTYLFGILVKQNHEVFILRSPKGQVTHGYYSNVKCKLLEALEDNGITKYYLIAEELSIGVSRVELLCSACRLAKERNNGFDLVQLKSKLKLIDDFEIENTVGNRFLTELLYKDNP